MNFQKWELLTGSRGSHALARGILLGHPVNGATSACAKGNVISTSRDDLSTDITKSFILFA